MGRLNVYIPEDLTPTIERWRDRVNLSELCVTAIRETLEALDTGRSVGPLLQQFLGNPSALERDLARRFALRRAIVAVGQDDGGDIREAIAGCAADFLQRALQDGTTLAIGGGRQLWSVVRRMTARSTRIIIAAIGVAQVDPKVLHAHPNTLVTLLWLLYSPRATAELVGSIGFDRLLSTVEPESPELSRIIIGSCSAFDPASSYAGLLGNPAVDRLEGARAVGDYLGVFLDEDAQQVAIEAQSSSSLFTAPELRDHSRRRDTIVALAAGGVDKLPTIRLTLKAELCNTLITDEATAHALLDQAESPGHHNTMTTST